MFSHDYGHRIEYPGFVDLVEVYAELVEEGAFQSDGGYHTLLLGPEQEKQEARFRDSWPHPLYGEAREVPGDPDGLDDVGRKGPSAVALDVRPADR